MLSVIKMAFSASLFLTVFVNNISIFVSKLDRVILLIADPPNTTWPPYTMLVRRDQIGVHVHLHSLLHYSAAKL